MKVIVELNYCSTTKNIQTSITEYCVYRYRVYGDRIQLYKAVNQGGIKNGGIALVGMVW